MGYHTFCTLYETYVLPVANYGAGVWGFKSYPAPQVLQHRINHCNLGMSRLAANASTPIQLDILDITYTRWLEILRYGNHLQSLHDDRLHKLIMKWEVPKGGKGWWSDLFQITESLHLPHPNTGILYDLVSAKSSLKSMSGTGWWSGAETKSKLRSFICSKYRSDTTTVVKANLSRTQRSLLAKLSCGTLPLQLEIGGYTNVDEEDRLCKICNTNRVETEYHFLFDCAPLQWVRSRFYVEHISEIGWFMLLPDHKKVMYLLSKEMVEHFATHVEDLYHARCNIIYKPRV